MSPAFLLPVLVAVSGALFQSFFFEVGSSPEGRNPEFRYSKAIRLFCWVAVVAISLIPVAFILFGEQIPISEWLVWTAIVVFGVLCCVCVEKFSLKFWDDHLTVGSFVKSDINYKDIVSAEIKFTARGSRILLIATGRKKVSVSGYLGSLNFADQVLRKKLSSVRKT
jgi:hypothetical protein